jgi:hypothetical protein
MKTLRAAALAVVLTASLTAAQAGRSCQAKPPEAVAIERSLALALNTARALDASGASVVVLARAGQDLSRHGLRWSHLGWAYKEVAEGSSGVWRVVHKLNHCGAADAALYRQGLAEFFLDDPFEYRAGFAVPAAEVQQRLLPLLRDNQRVATMHVADYNMVAYPWSTRYQQSNQWALETLALAVDDAAGTREKAQAWLQLKDYRPTTLQLSTMTRLGARLTAANIAFDDHPNEKRFANRIETVTVDSVFTWLQRSGLAGAMQELR